MAKVNADGTIDGEMKEVKEEETKQEEQKSETGETKKEKSKPKKALKIAGGILTVVAVAGLSFFGGTKFKR